MTKFEDILKECTYYIYDGMLTFSWIERNDDEVWFTDHPPSYYENLLSNNIVLNNTTVSRISFELQCLILNMHRVESLGCPTTFRK
jgi:hypothetical protein